MNPETDLHGIFGVVTSIGVICRETTVYGRIIATEADQDNLPHYRLLGATISIGVEHPGTTAYGRMVLEAMKCRTPHQANLRHIGTLESKALALMNHLTIHPPHVHFRA